MSAVWNSLVRVRRVVGIGCWCGKVVLESEDDGGVDLGIFFGG